MPPSKKIGVLLLAYDVDVQWRRDLDAERRKLGPDPVESVDSASDSASLQRAIDKLTAQHVGRIIAVPLEPLSAAPWLAQVRADLGLSSRSQFDLPDPEVDGPAKLQPKPIVGPASHLKFPTQKPVSSPVPIALTDAMDRSPVLVDILADRAKALARNPGAETLVLVAIAPRSDDALRSWTSAAQDLARRVAARAGFADSDAIGVREGVRSDQINADRAAAQVQFRRLSRRGRIVVVPLSSPSERVKQLLDGALGLQFAYRWNGQGIRGDRRFAEWIKASVEAAKKGEQP